MSRVALTLFRLGVTSALAALLGLMAWALIPVAAGWHGRVVLSGSMRPGIEPGDVVLTASANPQELRPGQAIAFRDPARPGRVDIHRIVRRTANGGFVTRGDANAQPDSTVVPAADIVGLPRLRVPLVGLPQYWWSQGEYAKLIGAGLAVVVAICVVGSAAVTHQTGSARRHQGGRHRARPSASVVTP